MTTAQLFDHIRRKRSYLCVGLDIDLDKMPAHISRDMEGMLQFGKEIIDATHELCVAYKPNTAFYEAYGPAGMQVLNDLISYIRKVDADQFIIADAKRGDIGNTSGRYARAFYDAFDSDAVTIAPYMGQDSVEPFLQQEGKYAILLALTSNPGSQDFQLKEAGGERLYEQVLRTSRSYQHADRLMYVVGATQASELANIREIIPHSFLLVPGVGAQGGSLEQVAQYGMNDACGLLVNSSRGILYQDDSPAFAKASKAEAQRLQQAMERTLIAGNLI